METTKNLKKSDIDLTYPTKINGGNVKKGNNSYEVYWIHLPEHTNITEEGYVGITKTGIKRRFYIHHREAVKGSSYKVHRAIRKYWDNIIVDVVCVCEEQYAMDLEQKLRPNPNTGWNINSGGQQGTGDIVKLLWMDPDSSFNQKGYREGLSERAKKNWSEPESRKKMMESIAASWEDPESLLGTEEWARRISEGRKKSFKDNPKLLENHANRAYYKDEDYRKRQSEAQKKAHSNNPELAKALSERQKAKKPWENNKANKELWKNADFYYSLFTTSDLTARQQSIKQGMKYWALEKIYKHFKAGWNPTEDKEWLEWKCKNYE